MEFNREYRRLMLEFSEGAIRNIVKKFQNDATEQEIRRELQDFEKYKGGLQKKDPIQYKSWIEFTEAIHAAKGKAEFKNKKIPNESQITSTDDIIADDENVTIYKGDSQDKCVMYGNGYTFCISRPTGGNMFSNYRLGEEATFYFIYFKKKAKTENDHIMVLDHNNNGYKWTFADNDTQEVDGGWDEIIRKYPELNPYEKLLINKELDDDERNLINKIEKFVNRPIFYFFNKFSYKEKAQALKSVINLPDDIWKTLDSALRNEFLSIGSNLTEYQANDLKTNEIERYKKTRDISTTVLMDEGNFQKNTIDSKYNETYKKIEKEQHDMILNMANKYKNGNFDISHKKIYSLPDISWLRISGNFYGSNNNLTSLEGMPKYVEQTCSVSSNNLKNLKGSPKYVGGSFRFDDNDILSLEGSPDYVGGSFVGSSYSLTSLKGSPKKIGGNFTLLKSPNLSTLDGISSHIGGYISVDNFSEEDARDYMVDLPKSNYSEFGDILSSLNKLKFKESKIQIESTHFDKYYQKLMSSFF